MNIEKFTKLFEQQFEDSDDVKFEINTNFKQLDEWSSIMSLLIITMVNDNYDIVINAVEQPFYKILQNAGLDNDSIGDIEERIKNDN